MGEIYCGERELGKAVLAKAVEDACAKRNSLDRREARLFLCAKNKLWENSLRFWCYMAGCEADDIISWGRNKWERS